MVVLEHPPGLVSPIYDDNRIYLLTTVVSTAFVIHYPNWMYQHFSEKVSCARSQCIRQPLLHQD